ncbi:hypothetical protein HYPSUDRAFT_32019 [Hypholoma sublateritium FD-334 SS-4]|uniref:Uncharacterized protein n=1 Tax=Hypholoma sublateritium (strain FD-334 SS-4) TaxID=945553 RepID=A0A0D2PGK2_HYPSF|nr:hypothetical protein HYPSUDRAFT_32019 [Hypholoma sublateritium FD-334 SS-4]
MSFNHAAILPTIGRNSDVSGPGCTGRYTRRRVTSDPCLPARLPTIGFIKREAESLAPKELVKQQLQASIEESIDTESIAESTESHHVRRPSGSSSRSSSSIKTFMKSIVSPRIARSPSAGWSNVQPYEVMRAVEEQDIMFLMEVRDKAFPLLLQSIGGETPLIHAIRTGNKDVAIVLLGAFSRWVNYLEDSELEKPQTRSYLKALRVGLKLAINEGLAKSQIELIASFMQTLIMSEGDKWVHSQVLDVARALNSGSEGKPVEAAGAAVRRFATKELGKADLIASLEDYISNATADLVMMGAWANALKSIKGESLPTYYFARDDRVYKAFTERLDRHKVEIRRSCNRRLKWQLGILRETLEGRSVTFRRKVEILVNKLDEGEGP